MLGVIVERILVYIVFCTIPFLGGNHLSFYYITIDRFWIENLFLIGCVFLLAVIAIRERPALSLFGKKYFLFFTPIVVVSTVSLFYTWNMLNTLKEINVLVWAAVATLIVQMLTDRKAIIKALIVGAFLSSICLMIQLTVVYPKLTELTTEGKYFYMIRGQQIPLSSFIHYNALGGYFASIWPLSVYFAIFKKKYFYILTTAVILAGLIITTTRVGIGLAFLTALLTGLFLAKDRNGKGIILFSVLLLAGVSLSFFLMHIGNNGGVTGAQSELTSKVENVLYHAKTLNTRTEIWKAGFKAFKEKPLAGYGAGAFEYPYKKYYDGSFATKYSHSVIIKIAVELGIIGIVCWIFYLTGLWLWIQTVFRQRKSFYVACAVLSFLAYGLLDFSFDIPAHVITFFLLGAMIQQQGDDPCTRNRAIEKGKMSRYAIIVPAFLVCIISLFFSTRVSSGDSAILTGEGLAENGLLLEASQNYEDAIEKMPLNNMAYIRASELMSSLYANVRDEEKKNKFGLDLLHYLHKMETIKDRNGELFLAIGTSYFILGYNEEAGTYLKRAVSYCPSSAHFVFSLAKYYFSLGDYGKAIEAIHSFEPYKNNYELSRNPNGFFVYKMTDLEVELLLRGNKGEMALQLARSNLADAEKERFLIRSIQAHELVQGRDVRKRLKERVEQIQSIVGMK